MSVVNQVKVRRGSGGRQEGADQLEGEGEFQSSESEEQPVTLLSLSKYYK